MSENRKKKQDAAQRLNKQRNQAISKNKRSRKRFERQQEEWKAAFIKSVYDAPLKEEQND